MLAEKLESWAKKERLEGRQEGRQETARNLIARTEMDDQMIAEISGLPREVIATLRAESQR
ncbi:hypothetical protein SAMN05192555_10191 [Franzmannia pantelleriensis]|uniref:Transposase n=1 Tax=Franzmannia pantelleriensis TaxID=48727 RepID=A0A1G9EF23_9GAMM|nr:hypothetical protein [Halomonas pantelleriensis]SDK74739.1 hypothetical protein SAMN05192555_10191 [Halomonas pantelleriensis]